MLFGYKPKCDIKSNKRGIKGRLSNFEKRDFVFDGIPCRSIEGVLQSFKFRTVEERVIVCGLWGKQAKLAGEGKNWQKDGLLFWNGVTYSRHSKEYSALLTRLYGAVYEQDEKFRRDLKRARKYRLMHTIGKSDPNTTVLTEKELITLLEDLSKKE